MKGCLPRAHLETQKARLNKHPRDYCKQNDDYLEEGEYIDNSCNAKKNPREEMKEARQAFRDEMPDRKAFFVTIRGYTT